MMPKTKLPLISSFPYLLFDCGVGYLEGGNVSFEIGVQKSFVCRSADFRWKENGNLDDQLPLINFVGGMVIGCKIDS